MKYLLPSFLFVLLLSGCKFSEKTLCTKWQITDVTFKGDLPETEKEQTRKEFMKQKTISFNSDHTMKVGDMEAKGWRMSAKADTVFVTENGTESIILVRKLSGKTALLEATQGKKSYSIHLSPLK